MDCHEFDGQVVRLERIKAVAVDSTAMPLGNATGMTPEERTILGRWIAEGAPIPPANPTE